jgi:hypothetical protein
MSKKVEAEILLQEIQEKVEELELIFRKSDRLTYERAKSYPLAHIRMALSNDHDYLGKDTYTIEDLIEDLDDPDDIHDRNCKCEDCKCDEID